jgi:hypothetical protein
LDYRGKEFAAQNGFCNAGDTTSYPGSACQSLASGTSQAVTITQPNGNQVQANVSQTQPAYLAKLLGLSTVTIGATAIAQVNPLSTPPPCVLSLQDPLQFQGSPTVTAPHCGLASNNSSLNSINFTGNTGIDVSNVGGIYGSGGCSQTGGTQCTLGIVHTSILGSIDPLSGLNSAIASLTQASFTGGTCGPTLTAYGPASAATGPCYNNGWNPPSNGSVTLSGVYFIDGAVTISGTVTITGTATLILLPRTTGPNHFSGGSLQINGNPTIQLTGPSSVSTTQVPPSLASVVTDPPGLMDNLIIYDPETTNGNQTVKITGSSTSNFNGISYLPNADVQYQGSTAQNNGCVEVIAKGITLSGNSNFDNTNCPSTNPGPRIAPINVVRLVQ